MKKILYTLLFCLIASLDGCGGGGSSGTASSGNEIPEFKPNEQAVMGYWTPQNPANYSYEFFPGPTEPPYNVVLKTGRILQGGTVIAPFFWSIQLSGTITINAVSPDCMARPVNRCPIIKSATIIAKGSSAQDASWSVAMDTDVDGTIDTRVTDVYHRADLDLSSMSQGEFFLTHSNNRVFDTPISGSVTGSAMAIRLDNFDNPIRISAPSFNSSKQSVLFSSDENSAIDIDHEFYIDGVGYRDLPVSSWYKNVQLAKSANGEYALTYELHRKVKIPAGIDASAVQIQGFDLVEKRAAVVAVVNKFIPGIRVQASNKFFASIELDFDNANAGNELVFTSSTEGTVSYAFPHHKDTPGESWHFTWVQRDDGSIVLTFPGYGEVNVRFIQAVNGGYQILYSKPDDDYGITYRIRDMVADAAPILMEPVLPGRYRFTSINPLPNGKHDYEITFHADKTVTGVVGGYWFQDANGDIVSFECTNLAGKDLKTYDECAAALDNTDTVKFAHIRRVRFMHKDGDTYQSKYNGTVYGGNFTAQGDDPLTFALTYRWVRVGDEPDDN